VCRLFGLIANKRVDIHFSFSRFSELSQAHPDGWGIGWYESGFPCVRKEPLRASESKLVCSTLAGASSSVFVAHVRKATRGSRSRQNCHPFSWKNWLFAHNGSVDSDALLQELDVDRRAAIQGETDSEVFFHWILQNIDREGSAERGIAEALSFVREHYHTGLNFLLSDGRTLYAYREAAKKKDYYSLYYLLRDPRRGLARLRSRELGVMLESKALNDERALLVCSEKLTEEDWRQIPMGCLLTAMGPGSFRLEKIA